MTNNEPEQLKKAKKRFLQELKNHNGDKVLAAKELGVNLVTIRSWRHKDPEFNAAYKGLVIGSDQSKLRNDRKGPFLELLEQGFSQREACEELRLSIVTLRTWKNLDSEFKAACLKARFGE